MTTIGRLTRMLAVGGLGALAWSDHAGATACDGNTIGDLCTERNTNVYTIPCPLWNDPFRTCEQEMVDELAKTECFFREWISCETGVGLCDAYPALNGDLIAWLEDERDEGRISSASECYNLGSNAELAASVAGMIVEYVADVGIPGASKLVGHFLNCACNEVDWSVTTEPIVRTLRVCNNSSYSANLAVGYRGDDGVWVAEGWWVLDPGQCGDPITGYRGNGMFYAVAKGPLIDADTFVEWINRGYDTAYFCVHRGDEFTYTDDECVNPTKFNIYMQEFGAIDDPDRDGIHQWNLSN
ncbi:DUF1036 domain-containing protein [Nannocystis pusilla]|uniref:DUF1036 domain-containing protein n=1 Tax=Nannocystis pusilla TaxID=889268 RepID=A0ABS7TJU4_9BACT|nr:DUF1036 domain-containing protein [Nannocystis pusilla]MBZ5708453.1 DUF1036 domain-containing protein [Nannocystis pusilla]